MSCRCAHDRHVFLASAATISTSNGFVNTAIATQTGSFTASFDATPSISPANDTLSFSNGAQSAYAGLAAIVRFNATGTIDARNGGAYAAATNIPFSAGKSYHFRMVINPASHIYSAYVTPSGGSELTIASNYAFRTEQAGVSSINNFNADVNVAPGGSLTYTTPTIASGSSSSVSSSVSSSSSSKSSSSSSSSKTPPNFGANVMIFDPSMSASTIQGKLNTVFNQQQSNQFGTNRYALLFKPGSYNVDVNVGFYTQVAGLGLLPDNVTINGAVHAEADWFNGNATQNFWRVAENLAVVPSGGTDRWAVSQASPFRRMHVRGSMVLDDGGWSSGGFIADSKIDAQVNSGGQQQWLTRNSQLGSWAGANWNMVFVGVGGAPSGASWPTPPDTVVGQAPVVREKPFLTVDASGNYSVFVPALRNNSSGISWGSGTPAGQSISIDQFYIAHPG